MNFEARKSLIESFVLSNFNYCPLVWNFSLSKSIQKIESIQKRALQFLFDDHVSSYDELLTKAHKSTMTVQRLRILCIEIYKTINNLNPSYMTNMFQLNESFRPVRDQHKFNLVVHRPNKVRFGSNSLRSLGPMIWNSLPLHIKGAKNLLVFKNLIKVWDGISCKCNVCSYMS